MNCIFDMIFFYFEKTILFFQILFQIHVLQATMGQKHSMEESILTDTGNNFNRKKADIYLDVAMFHRKISASKVQRQNDCGFSCHSKY